MFLSIAEGFPSRGKVQIAFDDYASFGHFCDDDDPYHVVIEEGRRTDHDQWCVRRRFPPGTPQPKEFRVGQFRVILVVHQSNSIRAMDLAAIGKVVSQEGKSTRWRDVGGAATAATTAYSVREDVWARQFVQDQCMSSWEDVAPGVRGLRRLPFRDDLVPCAGAKDVIAKVRRDRSGLGFFCWNEPPGPNDLSGARVVPVSAGAGSPAVAPGLGPLGAESYPLCQPISLYVHPSAPAAAWEFCKFAAGPEAASIVKRFGLWPESELEEARAKERLAQLKRGEGATIRLCDLTGSQRMLEDLALKFVKAKAAVQLKVLKAYTRQEAVEKLLKAGVELLLTAGPATRGEARGTGGEGQTAFPPVLSQRGPDSGAASPQSPSPESPDPLVVEIGRMAVGIVVHPRNLLDGLPLDELRGILCGQIKQWPGASGAASVMHVYGLPHTDAIAQLLKQKLGSGRPATEGSDATLRRPLIPNPQSLVPTPLTYTAQPDSAKVVLAVAQDPLAIGFVDLSQLAPDEKSVKLLDVYLPGRPRPEKKSTEDATSPKKDAGGGKTKKTAGRGRPAAGSKSPMPDPGAPTPVSRLWPLAPYGLPEDYPLVRPFTLYVSPQASRTVQDFAEFVGSEACAETLIQYRLVPSQRRMSR